MLLMLLCCCRWDDGGPQPVWWELPMSQWHRVSRVLGGTTVGNHLLRQLRPGHVDRVPVHHAGGLDRYALLGESKSSSDAILCRTFYLTENTRINIFISLETLGFLNIFGWINPERIVEKSSSWSDVALLQCYIQHEKNVRLLHDWWFSPLTIKIYINRWKKHFRRNYLDIKRSIHFALLNYLLEPHLIFQIHDSQGSTWQFMYFVSMVVLGAFFVMNLILGVLSGWVKC